MILRHMHKIDKRKKQSNVCGILNEVVKEEVSLNVREVGMARN